MVVDKRNAAYFCALQIFGFIIYGGVLRQKKFLFDDRRAIEENLALRADLNPLYHLALYDFWGAPIRSETSTHSWRPLVSLSFRLQKSNLFWMHFFNIFLHATNAFLFERLSQKCLDTDFVPHIGGFLFLSYPVMSEAVYTLVGRADMLVATILLVLLGQIANEPQNEWLMLAAAVATIPIKETGLILFPLFLASQFLLHRQSAKSVQVPLAPLAVFVVLASCRIMLTRVNVAKFSQLDNDLPSRVHALGLIFENVRQMVCPISLCHDWSKGTYSFSEWNCLGSCLIAILVGKLLLHGDKWTKTSILLSAFLYLPSSNLISFVGFIRAERCLYPVSIGFLLFVLRITNEAMKKANLSKFSKKLLHLSWIVIFSAKAHIRGRAWLENELILSETAAALGSVKSTVNLALAYADLGQLEKSEILMRSALSRHQSADMFYNFGSILFEKNESARAESSFQSCLRRKRSHPLCLLNLGVLNERSGEKDKALGFYEKCFTNSRRCRFNLGRIRFQEGNYNRSLEVLEYQSDARALVVDYNNHERASYFSLLAINYLKLNQNDKAKWWLERALAEDPLHKTSLRLKNYL
ncbi:Oidioi.mRNA.OKI2018_I69.XSR.g13619.t1.cds [Oikopleura dioica]|uniref:Oidioi.mRNA.OKI2018_I69.XSR.g13619.t1.cds n=1 Tax=Oikopleura dioica TaxID=34765 RepID=A0ABN7SB48_OIKDI|nr:Oidioi.mRNA.OKI2018_I69.XSR.g13619.t1.cds [Oikopleura dioica]